MNILLYRLQADEVLPRTNSNDRDRAWALQAYVEASQKKVLHLTSLSYLKASFGENGDIRSMVWHQTMALGPDWSDMAAKA